MYFPRENLINFDLYPFVTIACDSNGFIIYKNELTKKLYGNVHVGARLSAYTNISISPSRIVNADFYGDKCTMFLCNFSEYTVITIFSIGCCRSDVYAQSCEEFKKAVEKLLEKEYNDNAKEKRSLLRDVVRKYETAKKCGAFASAFLENQNLFSYDIVTVSEFISSVINIINNRLDVNVKMNLRDDSNDTPYIRIKKATLLTLLNFISFAILNSENNVNVTISTENDSVNISFDYNSKHIFENIFKGEGVRPYIFTLLTGIDNAESNGIKYSFTHQNHQTAFNLTLPLIVSRELIFNSENSIEKIIEEYLELSKRIFTN